MRAHLRTLFGRVFGGFCVLVLLSVASMFATEVYSNPLQQPSICSAIEAGTAQVDFPFCRVAPTPGKPGQHDVTLMLSATTSPVHLGNYRLAETDNYNGGYLPPTVEVKPGDTLKVRLLNSLARRNSLGLAQGGHAAAGPDGHSGASRKTNLHTHGLIVSAKNASPELLQNGDNIFVQLDRGQSMDYSIDIPGARQDCKSKASRGTALRSDPSIHRRSALRAPEQIVEMAFP
jgi:FtsP/CotA-like multicopper oxidase with cupredoxin domain